MCLEASHAAYAFLASLSLFCFLCDPMLEKWTCLWRVGLVGGCWVGGGVGGIILTGRILLFVFKLFVCDYARSSFVRRRCSTHSLSGESVGQARCPRNSRIVGTKAYSNADLKKRFAIRIS